MVHKIGRIFQKKNVRIQFRLSGLFFKLSLKQVFSKGNTKAKS